MNRSYSWLCSISSSQYDINFNHQNKAFLLLQVLHAFLWWQKTVLQCFLLSKRRTPITMENERLLWIPSYINNQSNQNLYIQGENAEFSHRCQMYVLCIDSEVFIAASQLSDFGALHIWKEISQNSFPAFGSLIYQDPHQSHWNLLYFELL